MVSNIFRPLYIALTFSYNTHSLLLHQDTLIVVIAVILALDLASRRKSTIFLIL